MDIENLEPLKSTLGKLSPTDQDHLAAFLLMERLKRNKLNTIALQQRIDDADPANWETWENTLSSLKDD